MAKLLRELRAPGTSGTSGSELWRSGSVALGAVIIVTNLIGVAALLTTTCLVVPLPPVAHEAHVEGVNAAARVEEATRQTGDPVLVTEHTKALTTGSGLGMIERPGVVLTGKTSPVRVYRPGRPTDPAAKEYRC